MKPKVFIGSSREGLDIANAIHANLTRDAECTVWANGVFQISGTTIHSLIQTLRESDFGIFVFSPDDLAIMRGNQNPVVRDNVIFELGLFVGRLGIERCFFITPDEVQDLRLPTDLMGVTPGSFESGRRDKNWLAATNPVCMQIRARLIEQKSFQDALAAQSATAKTVPSSTTESRPTPENHIASDWLDGKVSAWKDEQQFGFVVSRGQSYYLHRNQILILDAPITPNTQVLFKPAPPSSPGKSPRAVDGYIFGSRIRGHVTKFIHDRGFGFIEAHDDSGHKINLFILAGHDAHIEVDNYVECEISRNTNGPIGINVRLIDEDDEAASGTA
jgi:cold shock CspA family protein